MLTRRLAAASPAKVAGFTLIEMMVAIVLGLLVVGAVLAFIVSLVRANSETVLSTRLNQELRATMALISNDVRRARGLMDPIAAVGKGGVVANPYSTIDLSTARGDDIAIEARTPDEVVKVQGATIAPKGFDAYNPAFDVTPARLVTGIITEVGVARPPYHRSLPNHVRRAEAGGVAPGS